MTAASLSIKLAGPGAPSSFRLFKAGWNETEQGRFLFDAAAAESVMNHYLKWGVDLSIDLEHQMLGDVSNDPTARDARGWCKLELRPDGSLWAVNVTWTTDGAERIAQKRQRYVSPAFEVDPETRRVSKMINVAITAMPATHGTPALVAASRRLSTGGKKMNLDPDFTKRALVAIKTGDTRAALELVEEWLVGAASDDSAPDGASSPEDVEANATDDADEETGGQENDGAEGVSQQPVKKDRAIQHPVKTDEAQDPIAGWDGKGPKPKPLPRRKLSANWRQIAREKGLTEAEFLRVYDKLGGATSQAAALQPEPINVRAELARMGVNTGDEATLTPQQLAICREQGCDPKDFAQLQAFRDSAKK